MSIYKNTKSIHGKPYTPFYYIIGWSHLDKWYVGSRTANRKGHTAHPDELMVNYFTSSDNVTPFLDEHGLPDIIWTFPCKTADEAIKAEIRIMREFHGFLKDQRWINENIGGLICVKRRRWLNERLSQYRKGLPSPNKGRKMSEEQKQKIRISMLGKKHSDEAKEKIRLSKLGKPSPIKGITRSDKNAA